MFWRKDLQMDIQKLKHKTKYEGVFMYVAPDGYNFWSENTNYGSVVYGGDCLENHYYLKEIKDEDITNNTTNNIDNS